MAKNKKKKKKGIWIVLVLLLLLGAAAAAAGYFTVLAPNVDTGDQKSVVVFIPTGSSYQDLKDLLYSENIIKNKQTFELLAAKKNLEDNVKPGRYRLLKKMGNNELINLLRSGNQEPVKVVINSYIRTQQDLAGRLGEKLEPDSAAFYAVMNDPQFTSAYGLNKQTILTMILPDTYEFFWTTSTKGFFDRMAEEYKAFWTEERKQKAQKLNLSQSEVSILASIVQKETSKNDEKPDIAGVYLNRLRIGMPLQADPTLVYALGDFSIKRVLAVHKEIDSPYNTYKYRGLPPGPIALASKQSIDAVLNARKHDFLYFVAKADFSGYHTFSRNYDEHLKNARKYQQELNRRRIMK